jgi:hypothetical protein
VGFLEFIDLDNSAIFFQSSLHRYLRLNFEMIMYEDRCKKERKLAQIRIVIGSIRG